MSLPLDKCVGLRHCEVRRVCFSEPKVKRMHCYSFVLVLPIQSSIYITRELNTS